MKKFHVLTTALAAAAFLAGCGGDSAGDQSPRVAFTQMVNFGDSLSDVGTYDVGVVKLQGGGHFSINGVGATGLLYINWTEFLAATLHLPQPCAAETGLDPVVGAVPIIGDETATFHDASNGGTCLNYAQGGSRVTLQPGPGNRALFNATDPSTSGDALGALTIPVHDQIVNYLNHNSQAFSPNALVTVLAGANDVFVQTATVTAEITAGLPQDQAVGGAVAAMKQAADDLASDVNTMILAKGATHVVVVNIPDASLTPSATQSGASGVALTKLLVQTFNGELATKLQAGSSLLLVDAFTASEDQATNKAQYGLTDVATSVCTSSSSLVCTKNTLIPSVAPAASAAPATAANTFEYADGVHPTPYGYRLLSELVSEQLAIKGWL
ncbi:SGNH/GDSL hydrolase family protein [Scleromatobacter humisilvae]|uniref:SGNH/GDSL hydrolase family protein n=1 Tax=Scleromatobacter humisilvae TaxID=2897159 RepID=A0A9X1YJE9_9BURK|nr:SGNH/GDSL hydrolase family protein [Scleromatobacter humisilvae]MCK9685492.1 SGNH/GDSL hydrolase family protein [Scleromatobacter humisilvae]